ncbi:hypothetical protein SAMN05216593_10142 [Pseudomonas asturiensis]|uniref:Uncharacterized protein n=1 Tax=Pseudomonas asturiensis TaxID=1190415 RepID=A0A1M7J0W0_9PSED|nr:hypothetical protein [Pseudomonas asturiensis]SHM46543.1 hypothetical protein SAMN05216593_10142 [Pseudomonas asturiensis]
MAIPVVTPLPRAPSRADGQEAFNQYADPFIAAMPPMVVQVNASLTWIGQQVTAIEGYAATVSGNVAAAKASADSAAAIAAAIGSQAGLPSMAGNARRALAVNANETGVSYQTLIMGSFIEPAMATASVSGTYALNVNTTGFFSLTPTAATTLTLSLPTLTTTQVMVFVVEIQQGSTAFAITWPGSIVWTTPGGVAPTSPNAGKRAEYILTVQGTTVKGRKGASN